MKTKFKLFGSFQKLILLIILLSSQSQAFGQSVQFDLSTLNFNGFTPPSEGTSLKFGPDNRLYLSRRKGEIQVYTIENTGNNNYRVINHEIIFDIKNIPNYDDIGTLAWDRASSSRKQRQVTGLEVVGTASNPIIYVGSSDPKWGGPTGDKVLDTNSGIITKLTWTGSNWDVVDLVRGLPRSEENHSTNAVEYKVINGKPYLLVASGGFTNAGAPSANFAWITEYALSAALLSIDLEVVESMPIKIDPISGRKYKYDIPTLDDPSRPNINGIYDPNDPGYDGIDVGDPFGGNDGLNMAMIVENGPVQIFSAGYRNAYDFVVTENGKVFITDNGPNTNWGGLPENEGNPNTVTNNYPIGEPGGNSSNKSASGEWVRNQDHLLLITQDINTYQFGSFYGGHPTPIRANPGTPYQKNSPFPYNPGGAGLYTNSIGDDGGWINLTPLYTPNEFFRTQILEPVAPGSPGFDLYAQNSLPVNWPPVPLSLSNPNEADYRDPSLTNPNGPQPEFVTIWKKNSNGLDEYRASNFNGALKGSLIAGRNEGFLHLVRLNPDGSLLSLEEDKWNLNGGNALGITCQGDNDIFPGTIWVATFDNRISILTPSNNQFCPSPDDQFFDPNADYDNDGFTNQDEIDNGTDYCSGASRPNDFDGDFISDLNDLDDDGDGLLDEEDPFQLGFPSNIPLKNELFSDKTDEFGRPFGFRGLGLTGLMNNGAPNPNWLNWLDKSELGSLPDDIYGGAAGAIQIAMTGGTANGLANNQEKGFQFGVNVGIETGDFEISGGLIGFSGPQMFFDIDHNGELGIQMGDGTQSNFLKLVFSKTDLIASLEIEDIPDSNPLTVPLAIEDRPTNSELVELVFRVNPSLGTVEPIVKIGQRSTISLGTKTLSGKVLEAVQDIRKPLAIGVFGSSGDQEKEFLSTFDFFKVTGEQPYITNQIPNITKQVSSPPKEFDLSDFFEDNFGIENLSFSWSSTILNLTGVEILGSLLTLSFPDIPYSGSITIRATDSFGYFVEQSFYIEVVRANQIIYRINAGGLEVLGENNAPNWEINEQGGSYSGSGYSVNSGTAVGSSFNFSNKHPSIPEYITESTFNSVFETQRENINQGNMRFDIPLESGVYIVNIYLGEGEFSPLNANERVFDIKIEESIVLPNLDLTQRFGRGVAAMEQFEINVTDGELNLDFIKKIGNPIVIAIEILGTTLSEPIVIPNPIQDQVSTVNEELEGNLLFTATGGVGTLHYSATNLPPGIDIEPVNGRLYGTVSQSALSSSPYNVTLWVSDSNSPIPNKEFSTFKWTILPFENWNVLNENQNYTERHENSFVQAGEKFYMMGGRENSRTIDVYDYKEDSWTALSNVAPVSFNHFQATEYKGYIWVIGAFENNNFPVETPASHIWIFDPVSEQYFQGPEIPAERRRGSAGLVVHNDKFYVIAGNKLGHSGQYVPYFDEYDPATGTWTVLGDAPRPRDHFHAAMIGDKIYVASGRLSGGDGGTFGPVIKEVDVYDFVTGTWSTLPSSMDIPTPRAGAIVSNFKNKLLVAGGEIPGSGNTDALDITEIFDPFSESWSTGPSLKFRRHGTQGLVSGDGLFVTGGSPTRGSGRQRNMEYFGLNNPIGKQISKSVLSGPSSIELLNGASSGFELNISKGNQGIIIREITFNGIDSEDFSVVLGGLSNSIILPDSSHIVRIEYQGGKDNPEASVLIKYDLDLEFEIPIVNTVLRVENFTLINPDNTFEISLLEENSQFQLNQVNGLDLNIKANTNPSSVGSVFISLSGPLNLSRIDNDSPYTLLSNEGINLSIGNYTLTATPYSGLDGTGEAGKQLSLEFSIVEDIISNIPVTGILVDPRSASVEVGSTLQLTATLSPSNATNQSINWSSSNENVATVSAIGLVSGLTKGDVIVTARSEDGNFISTSAVSILENNSDLNFVGHWKMDEGSGNIFIDHSGNGNNGTIQNTTAVSWSEGIIGQAVNLNGLSGRFAIVPHNPSLEIDQAITISAWVKPSEVGWSTIMSKSDGNGFDLSLRNNGIIEFRLNRGNNGTAYRLFSNYNYSSDLGKWIHVAATFDGTTSRIFINGIEDTSASYPPFGIGTATGNLVIAALGTIQRFKGSLDDLRLYGRTLSSNEVLSIFNRGSLLPEIPKLLLPTDNFDSIIAPEAQLSWLPSEFALGYQVQVSNDNSFINLVQNEDLENVLLFNASGLTPNSIYFWRVRSFNIEAVSEWSEIRSFSTLPEDTEPNETVGHWKMDEGSGNIFIDHSGNGNNGTIQNTTAVFWSEGIIGQAVNLNGLSGRFAIVPHNPSLEIDQAITISAWVKPSEVGWSTIMSKSDGNGFDLSLRNNGIIEFRLNRGNNGTAYRLFSNYNYSSDLGKWIHVAATFDGTTSRIFINGIEDASASYPPFSIGTTSGNLVIAALGTIQRFKGSLDDLRLYGKALLGFEILEIYSNQNMQARKMDVLDKKYSKENQEITASSNNEEINNELKIYPNPVRDNLVILINKQDPIVELAIYDMMGKQILLNTIKTENGIIFLDLANLQMSAGTYLLFLNIENAEFKKFKFIKK
ncbi:malectin domain-containing carbohydrate-binding protein [Aquiflexum sp. LQ15W]|uniref:LamG-like jellyroll fold domain-containing protein n=1 Tax=Cognataquiflexum nitidum TaxID=2922272 RepID=UPI001F13B214|nr:LamG-like jellyroll fold domain-containing protein [Cognataquiflexum nitidum]MCH6201894.1 malectin domain-containing carbohydrate-binding protein [Cognataquiflexum nitidum]